MRAFLIAGFGLVISQKPNLINHEEALPVNG